MIKSSVITAGIGLSSFRDLKIELQDDTYKGRREEKSQTDLFLDVMYAYKMDVQDIIYYHPLQPLTGEYEHLPQRLDISGSPVNRIGFRIGMQSLSMYNPHFGSRTLLEIGVRPGPKTNGNGMGTYLQLTYGIIFGARRDHE